MAEDPYTAASVMAALERQGIDSGRLWNGCLLSTIARWEPHELAFCFHESFRDHEDYNLLSFVSLERVERGAAAIPVPDDIPPGHTAVKPADFFDTSLSIRDEAGDIHPSMVNPALKERLERKTAKFSNITDIQKIIEDGLVNLEIPPQTTDYLVYFVGGGADSQFFYGEEIPPGDAVIYAEDSTYRPYWVEILGEDLVFLVCTEYWNDRQRKVRDFFLQDWKK